MQSFAAITGAIESLKVKGSRKGVSRAAIKGALPEVTAARINVALKKVRAVLQLLLHSPPAAAPRPSLPRSTCVFAQATRGWSWAGWLEWHGVNGEAVASLRASVGVCVSWWVTLRRGGVQLPVAPLGSATS